MIIEQIGKVLAKRDFQYNHDEYVQRKQQDDEEVKKQMEQERINNDIDKLFERIGERFRDAEITDFSGKLHDIAKDYIDNFDTYKEQGEGLLFYGKPGNGKTRLVAAIAKEVLKQGYRVTFQSLPVLLDRIRTSYNSDDEKEDDITKPLQKAQLLILDDIGAEKWSEWVESKIYTITDYRYRNKLPTILTSNLGEQKIKKTVGYRTYDRLLEVCLFVENDLPSYRERKAEERIKRLRGD